MSHQDTGRTAPYRIFVAISLPEDVRHAITAAQAELRGALPPECVRWTKPGQFHLTLKFLGGVEVHRLEALSGSVRGACEGLGRLPLRAGQIRFFPTPRHPRVVWVRVQDRFDRLSDLQRAVETATADFTSERPEGTYTGHITLGRCQRIKRPQAESLAKLAAAMENRLLGEWTAETVDIIRSELSSSGSRYTTLATCPLGGQPIECQREG